MTTVGRQDINELLEKIRNTREKEVYRLVEKTRDFRWGIGVRRAAEAPSFFLELIVRLSTNDGAIDIASLERTIVLLRLLHERGYALSFQDGSPAIACEKGLTEQSLMKEYREIQGLLRTHLR